MRGRGVARSGRRRGATALSPRPPSFPASSASTCRRCSTVRHAVSLAMRVARHSLSSPACSAAKVCGISRVNAFEADEAVAADGGFFPGERDLRGDAAVRLLVPGFRRRQPFDLGSNERDRQGGLGGGAGGFEAFELADLVDQRRVGGVGVDAGEVVDPGRELVRGQRVAIRGTGIATRRHVFEYIQLNWTDQEPRAIFGVAHLAESGPNRCLVAPRRFGPMSISVVVHFSFRG